MWAPLLEKGSVKILLVIAGLNNRLTMLLVDFLLFTRTTTATMIRPVQNTTQRCFSRRGCSLASDCM